MNERDTERKKEKERGRENYRVIKEDIKKMERDQDWDEERKKEEKVLVREYKQCDESGFGEIWKFIW